MKRVLAAVVIFGLAGVARADEKVDFVKQIKPILAEACYKCHGEKKQKGKLRLDSLEAFQKGGKDGKVIENGDPDKSGLYHRVILPKDDDDVMPPEGDKLSKEKTDLIKAWIAQGASFGDWKTDVGTAAAGAANDGPKEPQLPTVAVADAGALAKIRKTGALAMPLAQNTNLLEVSLNLVGDQIEDAQLADLAPVAEQVANLNLAKTHVTDDGLKAIEPLKNLRRLHLENTKIGDAGLVHLKNLTTLEYLNLYGTSVTDAGLDHLSGLKNLKALYLWQSKVTPEGVAKLKLALPKCEINTGFEQAAK